MPPWRDKAPGQIVAAYGGREKICPDPEFEVGLAGELIDHCGPEQISALFSQFTDGIGWFDFTMRRICLRALASSCGTGVQVGRGVVLRHAETFEIGDRVVIGDQAVLQGREDGRFQLGHNVWIGAQCFLDAHDLALGDYVGLGPGVRILGSQHTGKPLDVPIAATDLLTRPVRIEVGADIGVSAVLMPGVTIGAGAIVGAGAVVAHDVPPLAKVAGAPACVIGWRDTLREDAGAGEAGDGKDRTM